LTEEEKKKMGRPVVGDKPKDKYLTIRVSEDHKEKLQAEKKRTGKSVSEIIIDFIENL
jgi:predicted DNA-binding protein